MQLYDQFYFVVIKKTWNVKFKDNTWLRHNVKIKLGRLGIHCKIYIYIYTKKNINIYVLYICFSKDSFIWFNQYWTECIKS